MDGEKHLGIRLEKRLHQRLRIRAIQEDRPVADLVRDAIARYLDETAKRRTPVKKAAGAE